MTNLTDLATAAHTDQYVLPEREDHLISAQTRDLAILILRCGCQKFVLIFGIPGNALNLAVFAKVRNVSGSVTSVVV